MAAKRDSAYYRARLQAEHPDIFAELEAGTYPSVREAAIAAGLIKRVTPLKALKREWRKAAVYERDDFLNWLIDGDTLPASIASWPSGCDPFEPDFRLTPRAIIQIKAIMKRRGIKMGDVMAELGCKRLNASLALAIRNGHQIKDPIIRKNLQSWLASNSTT